jgi:hypothetical protein
MNFWATMSMLFTVTGLVLWMSFTAGQVASRAGYVLASISFVIVIGIWGLIATEDLDEPSRDFGLNIALLGSLFFLSAGTGLIAGAMKNMALIVGFASGLAIFCVIHLWLVRHASPLVGAPLVMGCCITGVIIGLFQKKENLDAIDVYRQ